MSLSIPKHPLKFNIKQKLGLFGILIGTLVDSLGMLQVLQVGFS